MKPHEQEMQRFKLEWDALWNDDNLADKAERRDELIAWKGRICAEDEAPLIYALQANGFDGNSVWDLFNTRTPYPHLFDTLIEHAKLDYLDVIKEGIFRALMDAKGNNAALRVLIDEWKLRRRMKNRSTRWVLSYAISHIAKGPEQLTEIADLLEGNAETDDSFVRRLKRSGLGRKLLEDRLGNNLQ